MNDNREQHVERRARDEYGLITGIQYHFNEDGSVNWRKMVKPEHVYPNEAIFIKKKIPVPPSAEGLDDNECIISLAGLKELLSIRGYKECTVKILSERGEGPNLVVTAKCSITFIPNYETEEVAVTREEVATAGFFNVDPDFVKYTHTIACNRALARTIRNFLNIHVVSKEEISDASVTENVPTTASLSAFSVLVQKAGGTEELEKLCAESGNTWPGLDSFKENQELCRKVLAFTLKKSK